MDNKTCWHCIHSNEPDGEWCFKHSKFVGTKTCPHFEPDLICANCAKYETCTRAERKDKGNFCEDIEVKEKEQSHD